MLEKNNLIFIYGKAGNYKSSLGVSLLNSTNKKACYINLDNNHLKTNDNIKVFDEVSDIGFIKKCISDYSIILIDYIELLEINKNELLKLKELVKNENKTLIIISCCSNNKELINNSHYVEFKEIADLMILTDR